MVGSLNHIVIFLYCFGQKAKKNVESLKNWSLIILRFQIALCFFELSLTWLIYERRIWSLFFCTSFRIGWSWFSLSPFIYRMQLFLFQYLEY